MQKRSSDYRLVSWKPWALVAIALWPVANIFLIHFRLITAPASENELIEEITNGMSRSLEVTKFETVANDISSFNDNDRYLISPSPECCQRKDSIEFENFCKERTHSKYKCQKLTVAQEQHNRQQENTSPMITTGTDATKTSRRRGLSDANVVQTNHTNNNATCKTIWVTGMSMGFDGRHRVANRGDGYALQYAAALRSYQENAKGLLQPVLILMTPPPSGGNSTGSDDDNNRHTSRFIRWLESEGVIVIQIHSLTFQSLVFEAYPEYAENGAIAYYLRFDIPTIFLDSHSDVLQNRPDICWNGNNKQHHNDQGNVVLYTDSDVLFAQPIRYEELNDLKKRVSSEKFLMYGQDFLIDRPKPSNTGVMLMHLEGFQTEWPNILRWGEQRLRAWQEQERERRRERRRQRQRQRQRERERELQSPTTGAKKQKKKRKADPFPPHDQLWLNYYFADPNKWKRQNVLLPPAWNWKVYWELEVAGSNGDSDGDSDVFHLHSDDQEPSVPIKIIHFHGPKPLDGVEEIAKCDMEAVTGVLQSTTGGELATDSPAFHPDYEMFVSHAMCCDSGKTASWTLRMYDQWKPRTSPW